MPCEFEPSRLGLRLGMSAISTIRQSSQHEITWVTSVTKTPESPESLAARRMKIAGLGYWLGRFRLFWVIPLLVGLPYLVQGTEHYESALQVRRYGLLGFILGWILYRCIGHIIKLHATHQRPISYNLLTVYCLSSSLLAIPVLYLGIRVTGPDAPMAALKTFSWPDAFRATTASLLCGCIVAYLLHATVAYLRGESVLFENQPSQPSTFWFGFVLPIVLTLALVMLVVFWNWR